MSVINNALSDIANKNTNTSPKVVKAEVVTVKGVNKLAWAIGGFALSLCLGGWAVSQQATTIVTPLDEPLSIPTSNNQSAQPNIEVSPHTSPTTKVIENSTISTYVEPQIENTIKVKTATQIKRSEGSQVQKSRAPSSSSVIDEEQPPILVASITSSNTEVNLDAGSSGTMSVQQVQLTPQQLAANAIERGKKELDSNDLDSAIVEFETALKYLPSDEMTRKRLAALYYGKTDLRKSIELLQHGIRLNEDSQLLRIALAKILIKENQAEAALSPLIYLPDNADTDYLSMRAALAQQVKNSDIAFETYQILIKREPDSARWWLGLAIQQERKSLYSEAKQSYKEAIGRVGVSKQTQAFIRDRMNLLNSLEDSSGAN